jgi:hypothetical protein
MNSEDIEMGEAKIKRMHNELRAAFMATLRPRLYKGAVAFFVVLFMPLWAPFYFTWWCFGNNRWPWEA